MQKTIMVVDDEESMRMLAKELLEHNGYKIVTAVDGDDCIDKLKSIKKPDLILMDIMMPGTPVSDVVREIEGIPIIFISVVRTSESEKKDITNSKKIVGFIEKPFDSKFLCNKVKEIIGDSK